MGAMDSAVLARFPLAAELPVRLRTAAENLVFHADAIRSAARDALTLAEESRQRTEAANALIHADAFRAYGTEPANPARLLRKIIGPPSDGAAMGARSEPASSTATSASASSTGTTATSGASAARGSTPRR